MTQTKFGEQACQKFRAKLDSYIDNELLAETNLEMIEHFSRCTSCTQEAQDRRSVRRRLRSAGVITLRRVFTEALVARAFA